MADLSNFQSLLQLSVALNVTFTIVLSIFGNSVSREKLIIQNLLNQAKEVRDQTVQSGEQLSDLHRESLDIWQKCYRLKRSIEQTIDRVDRLAFDRFRPIALLGACVCFVFLVVASFPSTQRLSDMVADAIKIIAIASLLPFLGFVLWSAYFSAKQSKEAREERVKLDEELTNLLNKLNPGT